VFLLSSTWSHYMLGFPFEKNIVISDVSGS
jgi:hypothetical protein